MEYRHFDSTPMDIPSAPMPPLPGAVRPRKSKKLLIVIWVSLGLALNLLGVAIWMLVFSGGTKQAKIATTSPAPIERIVNRSSPAESRSPTPKIDRKEKPIKGGKADTGSEEPIPSYTRPTVPETPTYTAPAPVRPPEPATVIAPRAEEIIPEKKPVVSLQKLVKLVPIEGVQVIIAGDRNAYEDYTDTKKTTKEGRELFVKIGRVKIVQEEITGEKVRNADDFTYFRVSGKEWIVKTAHVIEVSESK